MGTSDTMHRFVDPAAEGLLRAAPMPRRALFLDRDGVVNVNHGYVHAAPETDWVPGIFELVSTANAAGYLPIVVTNQAGIARGLYDEDQFLGYTSWVHDTFRSRGAALLATYYCPHHPEAGTGAFLRTCQCRKPAPGLILAAATEFGIDLAASLLVGDQPSDLQAASAAGVGDAWQVPGGPGQLADISDRVRQLASDREAS